MEQHFRISIIVPVYKVEKYINRCIKSIIEQDMDDTLMECILVDDCSPDNSIKKAKEAIESFSGNIIFRFITHEKNRGLSAARNTGILAAKGDYILFIDSDDYLEKGGIKAMANVLSMHPNIDCVISNYYHCKEEKIPFPITNVEYIDNVDKLMVLFYKTKVKNSACFKLVSRKQIIDNNIFFVEGLLYEDVLWSYRQYTTSKSVVLIPDVTYVYEYNPQSIVNTTIQKIQNNINSLLYIPDHLLKEPYQGHIIDFTSYTFTFFVGALYLMLTFGETPEQKAYFKAIRQKIITKTIKNRLIFLSLFFLILYMPFSLLLKNSQFRHIYDKLLKVATHLEKATTIIHK